MVRHIRADITQHKRRNNRHPAEPNASIIHPLIALRVGDLPGRHKSFVGGIVGADAGDLAQTFQQRAGGDLDGCRDVLGVCDVELCHHDAADVMLGVRDEFGKEDVVVDAVADAASHDTDG